MVELTTPQQTTAEIYYSACGQINRHNRCHQESLDIKKLDTKDGSKRFNLSVFAMDVVDIWLAYQVINRTADNQNDFYNYLAEEMTDNTYNRFMIPRAEGRRRIVVDPDDKTVDDDKPLFGQINRAPICGITLHVTSTNKSSNKRDGTETQ